MATSAAALDAYLCGRPPPPHAEPPSLPTPATAPPPPRSLDAALAALDAFVERREARLKAAAAEGGSNALALPADLPRSPQLGARPAAEPRAVSRSPELPRLVRPVEEAAPALEEVAETAACPASVEAPTRACARAERDPPTPAPPTPASAPSPAASTPTSSAATPSSSEPPPRAAPRGELWRAYLERGYAAVDAGRRGA
jgi:hypothetical protein